MKENITADEIQGGMSEKELISEYELYRECLPTITRLAQGCMSMNNESYNDYKKRSLEEYPEGIKAFFSKVFIIIDHLRQKQSI